MAIADSYSRFVALIRGESLRARATRGALWLVGATVVEQGARFVRLIILTKLLLRVDFGLMALVLGIIQACEAFTEVGVRHYVIQSKQGGSIEVLNVAWWISTARGAALYLLGFLLAPVVAGFYERPELAQLMRVALLVVVFRGIMSPRVHVLEREFKFARWIAVIPGTAVIATAITIAAAFGLRNVWALVIGLVAEGLLGTVMSYVLCPFRPRFRLHRESARELAAFSRGVLGLPVLMMLFLQAPVFVIGKVASIDELGLYSRAAVLAYLPVLLFTKTVLPAAMPMFSRLREQPLRLGKAVGQVMRIMLLVSLCVSGFIVVFARPILVLVCDPQYAEASIALALLGLSLYGRLGAATAANVFFAMGRPGLERRFAIARSSLMLAMIYGAVRLGGINGAALALLVSVTIPTVIEVHCALRLTGCSWKSAGFSGRELARIVGMLACFLVVIRLTLAEHYMVGLIAGCLATSCVIVLYGPRFVDSSFREEPVSGVTSAEQMESRE